MGAAAQLTLVVGSDGSGLAHPDWMENLRLAVAIQEDVLSQYPTLMRPLLLRNSRYNQHATTGSLLVEVGAAGNSRRKRYWPGGCSPSGWQRCCKPGASREGAQEAAPGKYSGGRPAGCPGVPPKIPPVHASIHSPGRSLGPYAKKTARPVGRAVSSR